MVIRTPTAIRTAIRTATPPPLARAAAPAVRRKSKPCESERGALTSAERRLICENCGQEFGCGRDNIGECWCNAETFRLPLPAAESRAADCLCPACLRQAAAKLPASPGSAERA
ncbi:MAG TPA: cysteine-rich CWC family protein [Xanthobacteraceae bacterium]|nr:cysteine-rich CWC family protein [Xanthobacteraceae bacterium]